jgi:adenosylmethionine-8-amino-7-oxononanoate aminotransferase/biotin synthase
VFRRNHRDGRIHGNRVALAKTLRALEVSSIPITCSIPFQVTPTRWDAPLIDEEIWTTLPCRLSVRKPGSDLPEAEYRRASVTTSPECGINAALIGDLLTTVGCNMDEDVTHFRQWGYEC